MWEICGTLIRGGRPYLTVLSMLGLMLVACQSKAASEVGESDVQPEFLEVAYQLQQQFPLTIQVTSTSIKHTGYLEKDFTCEGGNLSPQLTWTAVPPETQSIAVVVDDIDAEEGALAHWVLWSLPADTNDLNGGASGSESIPGGAVEGTNGYGTAGWRGPCPPPRKIFRHRTGQQLTTGTANTGITSPVYQINVYALDTEISAPPGTARDEVLRQIDGHILAGGSVSTKYLSSIVIRE